MNFDCTKIGLLMAPKWGKHEKKLLLHFRAFFFCIYNETDLKGENFYDFKPKGRGS